MADRNEQAWRARGVPRRGAQGAQGAQGPRQSCAHLTEAQMAAMPPRVIIRNAPPMLPEPSRVRLSASQLASQPPVRRFVVIGAVSPAGGYSLACPVRWLRPGGLPADDDMPFAFGYPVY